MIELFLKMAPGLGDLIYQKNNFILGKIEGTCLDILHSISAGRAPQFSFPRRSNWDELLFDETVGIKSSFQNKHLLVVKSDRRQSIRKFGNSTDDLETLSEKFKFQILRFMCCCSCDSMMTVGMCCCPDTESLEKTLNTKFLHQLRDIFYQHPDLYQNQAFVDRIIDDIACMLEIPRWELHILATCKGLVTGALHFEDEEGIHIDCHHASKGVQIAAHTKDMQNIHTNAKFVLVVEKDATFQKLLDCNFCKKMTPCILITGKGFPDNGTRLLLKQLWVEHGIPIFILVDADPHGIEIMAVYKYGSKSQAFENKHLAVPSVEWIGIWPEDIKRLNIKESSLLKMNKRDILKAEAMKKRPYFVNDDTLLTQIDIMMAMGLKAEIQCLDAISSNYLCDVYLPMKIDLLLPE